MSCGSSEKDFDYFSCVYSRAELLMVSVLYVDELRSLLSVLLLDGRVLEVVQLPGPATPDRPLERLPPVLRPSRAGISRRLLGC